MPSSQENISSHSGAQTFDYIITGAGCAGLSLLMRMMQHPFFNHKQILVIDQSPKNKNDRTWCFWEKECGLFESIVHHRWKQIDFYSNHFSARFDIAPYEYKMIRSIDFYNYVLNEAKQHSNIHFYYGNVTAIKNENGKAGVKIDKNEFHAQYIFNSILFDDELIKTSTENTKGVYHLLQHFKGWLIETNENVFDERIATFMDFRVSQQQGTTFTYGLPVSSNKALVEYTLFSKTLLPQEEYDRALKEYMQQFLQLHNYTILEEEFGVIPMTNKRFITHDSRIINIGTAGGQTKSSSGYTFRFIQKHTQNLIELIVNNKPPVLNSSLNKKKFSLYDSVLLNVLHNNKMRGDEIFAAIFKKNPPQRVLQFLDNETSLFQDLKILAGVPTSVFLPATVKEIWNKMSG